MFMIPDGIIGMVACIGDSVGAGILGGHLAGAGAGDIHIMVGVMAGDTHIMAMGVTILTMVMAVMDIPIIIPEEAVVHTIMEIEGLLMEETTQLQTDTAQPAEVHMALDIQPEQEIQLLLVQHPEPEINQVVTVTLLEQIHDTLVLHQLHDPLVHLHVQAIILPVVPEVLPVVVPTAAAVDPVAVAVAVDPVAAVEVN